ncbi:MAG: class I SAM-dependent methyltransferase [Candidatus Omnitrophica bacterium]|nr:class I SAM-dependent methyltransferase [Candidatus Omnitrophota bacterium]
MRYSYPRYQEYLYSSGEHTSGKNALGLVYRIKKEITHLREIKKICELGCGNGYLANFLAPFGYDVTGVDLSKSGIEQAHKHYEKAAKFLWADIKPNLCQQLGSNAFDLVIAKEVIEHLYRPSDLIKTAQLLLKPNGYLLLTTPYHGYLKNLLINIAGLTDSHFNPLWDCGHIKFFSVKTLTALVHQYNFQIISFKFWGRLPWLWKSMICIAEKKG